MTIVDAHGVRLHVIDEGQGPPLVFVHGFPLDHHMWDAQRREFRTTHRVIIPDLRGFGRSEVTDPPGSMEQFADDVAALLDALGVQEPVTLCGLSMGGCVAFAFARRCAARLRALVICDARAVTDTPETLAVRRQIAQRVLTEGPLIVADAMLPRLFGPRTKEDQPQVIDAVRNVILATSARGIAAGQLALAGRPDCTDLLPQIGVPTLVVCGEHDIISPPDEMRALAGAIPQGEFVLIPQAGHMAPLEQPAAVNAALRAFLERLG